MARVATLTVNPGIDVACEADAVRHTQKTRTFGERMQPGGGGINVARVLSRFGAEVEAIFLAGGITGQALDDLLERGDIERRLLPIADDTRLNLNVYERSSGLEYRFVPEGPTIEEAEWQAALRGLEGIECDYFVASGSLAPGLPDDFYARVRDVVARTGVRFILDTSGPALSEALAGGGIFLLKPTRGELEELARQKLERIDDLEAAARQIVEDGLAEHVAVTLGRDGALLVNRDGASFEEAFPVKARSAVGAGDSFVAGMTFGFASGMSPREAFRFAMACGAAAVLNPGSDLCHPDEVHSLFGGPRA